MFNASGKILGVGLPRTGTVSLAKSLIAHELRVAHGCRHYATFENADAACGFPVFCDYPELTQRFAGSRFILTTRPVEDWLDSVGRTLADWLQRTAVEVARRGIRQVPERAFLQAFGTLEFTPDTFAKRFGDHESTVVGYARRRDIPLLVLRLEEPDEQLGRQLAEFLASDRLVPLARANENRTSDWDEFVHPFKVGDERPRRIESPAAPLTL